MSSRIYSEETYQREIDRLKLGYLHCPECYSKNIDYKTDEGFTLFHDYICKDCKRSRSKNDFLTLSQVRNKKINKLLK